MIQNNIPHNQPPFQARDISDNYGYDAFDIVFCHPTTWRCFYLEEPMCSTLAEANAIAENYNKNGWPDDIPLESLESPEIA